MPSSLKAGPFVANEDNDNIVTFRIDRQTGMLPPGGEVLRPGSPVCIFGVAAEVLSRSFPPLRVAFAEQTGALPRHIRETRNIRREECYGRRGEFERHGPGSERERGS